MRKRQERVFADSGDDRAVETGRRRVIADESNSGEALSLSDDERETESTLSAGKECCGHMWKCVWPRPNELEWSLQFVCFTFITHKLGSQFSCNESIAVTVHESKRKDIYKNSALKPQRPFLPHYISEHSPIADIYSWIPITNIRSWGADQKCSLMVAVEP